MKSIDIRQLFLDFFSSKGHVVVPSSSLIPQGDSTLLFNNAGMNQFKNVFLGKEQRPYKKATSVQRCVRAGGKHNDLENVGYTSRHHTFFEMLGNFSFGDYFKREAIVFAWNFLTVELGLPKEKLWITVHKSDTEAESIWLNEIGVDKTRFSKLGDNDNFWSMGDTGPCGPCSEIFYDHGHDIAGDPPGGKNAEGDRFVEIWNMVFMQFNRLSTREMVALEKPCIDTGMGLERIAAVMQGVSNNYDIDIFQHILAAAGKLAGGVEHSNTSLRVIADHIRSCAFLIADGVIPSNEGRGYTLRRILRRGCRHGHKLGIQSPFLHLLIPSLIEAMGDAAEPIKKNKDQVCMLLQQEETQFNKTLEKGLRLLQSDILNAKNGRISGKTVFDLYDTYGFPVDLTNDIAREYDLSIDLDDYQVFMEKQRSRSRSSSQFNLKDEDFLLHRKTTIFTGYNSTKEEASVISMYVEGKQVTAIDSSVKEAFLIMDKTPFYAESGGQIGDTGIGSSLDGNARLFDIVDTQKKQNSTVHHIKNIQVPIKKGQKVILSVNKERRNNISKAHSATHLLHASLRSILGESVQQQGSLVTDKRLRFDFSHLKPVSQDELDCIQQMVNEKIRENTQVQTEEMGLNLALEKGALALFDEKYDQTVRVLSMAGHFSVELCGGIHVKQTGDIGLFLIVSESSIASGVRRIEAIVAQEAMNWVNKGQKQLKSIAAIVKANPDQLTDKIADIQDKTRQLEQENIILQQRISNYFSSDLAQEAMDVKGVKVLVKTVSQNDVNSLRELIDQLKMKLGTAVIFLAMKNSKKVAFAAGVTNNLVETISAKEIIASVTTIVNGKGGGRADFAQGGCEESAMLSEAMASVISLTKKYF